jgi:hypothetical protein
LARNGFVGGVVAGALAIGLSVTGEPLDSRLEPWATSLIPVFFLLLGLSSVLLGLANLQPAAADHRIVRLRLVAEGMRLLAITLVGVIALVEVFVA